MGNFFTRFSTSKRAIFSYLVSREAYLVRYASRFTRYASRINTPHPLPSTLVPKGRNSFIAGGLGPRATISKAATGREIQEIRYRAGDGTKMFLRLFGEKGDRIQKSHRIRMLRHAKESTSGSLFDHLSRVHHQHLI